MIYYKIRWAKVPINSKYYLHIIVAAGKSMHEIHHTVQMKYLAIIYGM